MAPGRAGKALVMLGGPGPTNPHHDPGFVRATHELRESRTKRLAGTTLSPWERRLAVIGVIVVVGGAATAALLRLVGS